MSVESVVVFRNAALLDPERGELVPDRSVVVEGERVVEVGGSEVAGRGGRLIDVRGRTLMPGLVDGHVHVTAVTADLAELADWSPYYVAARTAEVLRGMLARGFTAVRDLGGADYGLAAAVDEGYLVGPRIVFGGKALSQTGGHGDMRPRGRAAMDTGYTCPGIGAVCDGVPEVRRAAREEIRRGAHHIKLMLSGGVASPTDRVDSTQFSCEEISAAVEEAEAANRYVAGHAYTARAVNRGLECGVRSIEHGNLLNESSIALFRARGAFYVPTLATYSALVKHGRAAGLPEANYRKVFDVLDAGLRALELAHRGGVSIVFGTDLLGAMHAHQSTEFTLRAQVQPPVEIIRSATTVAARLLGLAGKVGVVAPGAYADLLVVDGNPLEDIGVLADPDKHLRLVMKAGRTFRESLDDRG
ncbi:MAG: amidohydrolase family protein [Chloroflexi bacterium]|nr:amidohydrolase family protein [Chloroflexota bacterium]